MRVGSLIGILSFGSALALRASGIQWCEPSSDRYFSPDHRYYVRDTRQHKASVLTLVDRKTGSSTSLSDGRDYRISWSPSGRYLLVVWYDGGGIEAWKPEIWSLRQGKVEQLDMPDVHLFDFFAGDVKQNFERYEFHHVVPQRWLADDKLDLLVHDNPIRRDKTGSDADGRKAHFIVQLHPSKATIVKRSPAPLDEKMQWE